MLSEKIVVIDDDSRIVKSLKMALIGYEIKDFSDAKTALNYLCKPNMIHLVMLDIMMPGIDGLKALQEIKKINKDIAVIMMTAYSTKDVAIEALRLKADEFIEKPFQVNDVKSKIQRILHEKLQNGQVKSSNGGYVDRIKTFVKRNQKNATLDFIGEEMSLSPKYISRMFSKKNGVSFRDFKLQTKIEKAKELLKKSHLNITEIAFELGYQNPESFMRLFKRLTNLTPSQYRKKFGKRKIRC